MSDGVNISRMEKRLANDIAKARTPLMADRTRVELAVYQARLGRFDACRKSLAALRLRNGPKPAIELSVWLHLAEGLLDYFETSGYTKADGVRRAHALAVAAGRVELVATCAAWLAQLDFAIADWQRMRAHLTECFRTAHPTDHASRARACLVAAQAMHLAGRVELARAWYQRSRDHALSDGDDATIGALMYNMSRHRMLLLRRSVLTQSHEPDAGQHALLSVESTARFDLLVGDSPWQPLKGILRAQIHSLKGDAALAVALYEQHLADAAIPVQWRASLLADRAWCCASTGRLDEARACAAQAIEAVTTDTRIDDLGAMHSRLAETLTLLADGGEAQRHAHAATRCWADFSLLQDEVARLMADIDERRPASDAPAADAGGAEPAIGRGRGASAPLADVAARS